MTRWLRRFAVLLGSVAGLTLLAVVALNVVSLVRERRTYHVPALGLEVPTDSAAIRRGRHLVIAAAACTSCHGEDLGGQIVLDRPLLGRFVAANLTRGDGGLPGGRSTPDLVRAIRYGVSRTGRSLRFMPSDAFQALSDDDLAAAIAYLRTVDPVDRRLPPTRVGPMGRVLHVLGFPLLPAERITHAATGTAPAPGATIAYGRHLADIAGCHGCHGPSLEGGPGPGPDLVRALSAWTQTDFRRALREGRRPDRSILADEMPWKSFAGLEDEEIAALWLYVRSIAVPRALEAGR